MSKEKNEINIFGLSASQELTNEICKILEIEQKRAKKIVFADGEILMQSEDSVRGKEVYVIQSTSQPVNENLMELLIAVDMFKRASAQKINVVIPYFGYARQDRKAKGRQPITAKLVANLIEKAGADRVIIVDLHSAQTMGFFDIPVDNFHSAQTMANEIINTIIENNLDQNKCILVSPDHGGLTRVHEVAKYTAGLTNGIAVIAKRRPEPNMANVEFVLGDIQDKVCFIVDDMIDTGGTIVAAATALKENGARAVYIFGGHGLFNGEAVKKITSAIDSKVVEKVVVTNTIEIPKEKRFEGLKIISVANLLATMIKASVSRDSLSEVYGDFQEETLSRIKKFLKAKK
ncbi:ribose-phosphate diphosphokinase [Spiroplasma alleghenense]|uniref:ribose-phosphate diphosphokinase n=1 Tax=Spiroplasma alleghenense TaxID=216931 RepID=A0A345Z2R5_9MOLU|nr:ribose-phosphate pyrophosphokinase [Spiroplasma alleghenense]AXK50894.1 ribose-phosphate pyrophosphokinase [Spiroplasma alleghenense]